MQYSQVLVLLNSLYISIRHVVYLRKSANFIQVTIYFLQIVLKNFLQRDPSSNAYDSETAEFTWLGLRHQKAQLYICIVIIGFG